MYFAAYPGGIIRQSPMSDDALSLPDEALSLPDDAAWIGNEIHRILPSKNRVVFCSLVLGQHRPLRSFPNQKIGTCIKNYISLVDFSTDINTRG